MKAWKLTTQDNTTHNGFRWEVGRAAMSLGTGELCGPGWLHFYQHPLLAVLLNPIHANIQTPKLWEAVAEGEFKYDRGLKAGCTKLTLIREVPLPVVTTKQRVAFAKGCAEWASRAARGPRQTAAEILAALSHIAEEAVK